MVWTKSDAETLGLGSYIRAVQSNPILQVKRLRKVYPGPGGGNDGDLEVLDDITFDVGEGELVTVIGPSGCGKSTLLNIIARLEPHEAGDVIVNGHRVDSSGPDIVMIFQEDALFPWLDVKGNVEFGLREKGIAREERRKIAEEYIALVGLTPFAGSYVHQLSGGMRQRVAIARGLALNPRILLMDEPFGALDAKTREDLQRQIQVVHEQTKKTILFVTHDVREAVSLGDRVILFTHRPATIKQQFVVDLPRPRWAEDPALHGVIAAVMGELKEERAYAGDEDRQD